MIDRYSLEGTDFMAGVQMYMDGRPRGCATSKAMELGWAKAEEAITQSKVDEAVLRRDAQPVPSLVRQLRLPVGLAMAAIVTGAISYALLTYHPAESAPVVAADDLPELSRAPGQELSPPDLGRNFHVVMTPAAPAVAAQPAPEPTIVSDTPEQLRAIEAARKLVAKWHAEAVPRRAPPRRGARVVVAPETSDLLSRGDELLKAGNAAAARAIFGRVANGTGPDAVLAADRLNQLDVFAVTP